MNRRNFTILITVLIVICCLAFFIVPKIIRRIQVLRWIGTYSGAESLSSTISDFDAEWIKAGYKIKGIEKILISLCKHNTTDQQTTILIRALSYFGTKESVSLLLEILEDKERNINERTEAAVSLGEVGGRSVVNILFEIVSSQDDMSLRLTAAVMLKIIGDPMGIPVIEKFLKTQQLTDIEKAATIHLLEQFRRKTGQPERKEPNE